jgi:hypothetical protein
MRAAARLLLALPLVGAVVLSGLADAQARSRKAVRKPDPPPAKTVPEPKPTKRAKLPRVVPYPPERPRPPVPQTASPEPKKPAPTGPVFTPADHPPPVDLACHERLQSLAVFKPLPPIEGPGGCGVPDAVELQAVQTTSGKRIEITPHAIVGCPMAEAFARWVRDEVDGIVRNVAGPLTGVRIAGSFECRGRNRVVGGRISQHGFGNAIDIGAVVVERGKALVLTDPAVDKELRNQVRGVACERFTTVLGPGSDGAHESHIHLDILQRRSGYRMCQWDVR